MKTRTSFKSYCDSVNTVWFNGAIVLLRVGIGLQFFMAGISKISGWSAEGFLLSANGPFAEFFQGLAGSGLVDILNIWGLIFIGLGLILGFMVRPASFFAIILMTLYYFAHFVDNTEHGLIDEHIILILVFLFFMAGGVGHIFGLDGLVSANMRKKTFWKGLIFG